MGFRSWLSSLSGVVSVESDDRKIIDDNADGNTYIGVGPYDANEGDPVWDVARVSGGNPTDIQHAKKIAFADRTSATYK